MASTLRMRFLQGKGYQEYDEYAAATGYYSPSFRQELLLPLDRATVEVPFIKIYNIYTLTPSGREIR
jgi:hypothetical protein